MDEDRLLKNPLSLPKKAVINENAICNNIVLMIKHTTNVLMYHLGYLTMLRFHLL